MEAEDEVECRLILNVVVGEGPPISAVPGEDQLLQVRRDHLP